MKRYLNCLSTVVFILFCFSTISFTQTTSDEQDVIDTLQAHFKACRESDDYREIISYFTPDAVQYAGGAALLVSSSMAGEKINHKAMASDLWGILNRKRQTRSSDNRNQ